jgi:hypothetical protein
MQLIEDQPQTPRSREDAGCPPWTVPKGRLKNGNPSGNWWLAPRCGARTRRQTPCQAPAVRHRKRCRLHGGKSTGPRTPEGLARSRRATWKHGAYSRETRERLRENRRRWRALLALLTP